MINVKDYLIMSRIEKIMDDYVLSYVQLQKTTHLKIKNTEPDELFISSKKLFDYYQKTFIEEIYVISNVEKIEILILKCNIKLLKIKKQILKLEKILENRNEECNYMYKYNFDIKDINKYILKHNKHSIEIKEKIDDLNFYLDCYCIIKENLENKINFIQNNNNNQKMIKR